MGIEIMEVSEDLLTVKVTGKLKKSELDRAQQTAIEIIRKHGKARFLVIAEDFQGWDNRGDWDDLSFQMQRGRLGFARRTPTFHPPRILLGFIPFTPAYPPLFIHPLPAAPWP
jgi:broad specificity phosphatase PhoE